jgi:hypothetical protein
MTAPPGKPMAERPDPSSADARMSSIHGQRRGSNNDRSVTLFETALGHHQAGNLREASRLYQELLALNPNHFDGLHCLGVLAAIRLDQWHAFEQENPDAFIRMYQIWVL